ncbi:MAG: ribosome biogenesis GTPase YlqF [Eubacterium sp.]|nr:ribosome biogenesis GTPase YlqF [Eubacterium sp.]
MKEIPDIQWFPGHMTKTRRMIEADIKSVDAVAEIVDARIPESSRNPIINELAGSKPRILLLNKSDYADDKITAEWAKFYNSKGYKTVICDCRSGKNVKSFIPAVRSVLSDVLAKRRAKGFVGSALRVMVVGIPNVGKSSFINRLSGSNKTKTADRPGVTRGKQWVVLDKDIELLDTPGILWPKFEDPEAALRLAYTGAVKDDVLDIYEIAGFLAEYLDANYPIPFRQRYKVPEDGEINLEIIARKRGMLISGGEPDLLRAAATVLDEFRSGKLGKISLERPIQSV